ncbi:MAG: CSLREA domain-containing protein [Chloroflexi bacterium]|nr:CSLREA domain-containing protein [Chloroflexota bacterium]
MKTMSLQRAHVARLFLIAALLLALMFGLAPTPVAHAAGITVNTTADEYGSGASCSLREAIQAANTDAAFGGCTAGSGTDTITLPAGTYTFTRAGASEDSNATGDLDVTSDITINGAGSSNTTIDAAQIDRVLHVFAGNTVELNGVTITNGKTPNDSAGHCYGGGVYNAGSLTIADSTISDNATGTIPGSHGCNGGGLSLADNSTTTIRRSTISNNVTGSTSNQYGGDGGGMYNAGALTVEDSIISGNTTGNGVTFGGYGGGIDTYGTLTMTRSTVKDNTTGNASGGSGQGGDGGGIFNYNYYDTTPLRITDSTLSGNRTGNGANSKDGRGGGLYTGDMNPTLTNVTISGNYARGSGGGVYIWGSTLTLAHVSVTNNTADEDNDGDGNGGGLAHNGGTLNFKNSIVVGNNDITGNNFDDCVGDLTSQGYNVVGVSTGCPSSGTGDQVTSDTKLKPLANNGGSTNTHFLLYDSPAVDAIPNGVNGCGSTYTTDQRGEARPESGSCDSGAYESPYIYWAGTGADAYTTRPENWNGNMVPTTKNIPVFKNTDKWADVQSSFTVAGWVIDSSYTGVIGMNNNLTVNGDWTQKGGEYHGYNGRLDVEGAFDFSSGTFTAPLGLMIVSGGFHHTGGTFNPNGGRVVVDSIADGSTAATTFNNLYLNDGLLAYWKLDEGAGTTAKDSSGYGYDGVVTNGSWSSSTYPAMDFTDPYAFRSDRTDSSEYVLASNLQKLNDAQTLTLSAWVWLDSAPTAPMRFITLENEKAVLRANTSNSLQFYMSIGGSIRSTSVSAVFGTGQWYHVAGTYDGSIMRLYLNGTQRDTLGVTGTVTDGNWVRLSHSANNEALDGRLDDVRIYNRALSSGEIGALALGSHPQTSLATTTLGAALDVNGDLTLNSGTLDVSTSNNAIDVGGDFIRNGGVFTPRNGTVTFDGSGTQSVKTDSIAFAGVQINGGATLELDNNITVSRDWTNNGGFTPNGRTVTFNRSGTQTLSGTTSFYDVTVDSGSTLRLAANANFGYSRNFSLSGSFDATTNSPTTVTIAGTGTRTLPSGASTLRNLTVNSGATLSPPSNLNIAGNLSINGGFLHNGGTVTFNQSGTQTFSGAATFNNVTINSGNTLQLAANAIFRVANALTKNGNFDASTNPGTSVLLPGGVLPTNTFNNLTINDGLLAYLKFDQGSGGTARDSSGFDRDGTLTNSPTWITDKPSTMDFSDPYALQFDGVDDYVSIDNMNYDADRSMTIAFWVKVPSGSGRDQTLVAVNGANKSNIVLLSIRSDDEFWVYDGSNSAWEADSNTVVADGTWHHIAYATGASWTGNLYVDGVKKAYHIIDYTNSNDNLWSIGQEWDSGGPSDFLAGSIDDVRIYNRGLSDSEIADLAAGKHPQVSAATVTLGANLDVNGNLTLNSGTLDVSASNYAINVAGNFTRNGGVFTARSGTVTFDRSGAQTLDTDAITFYNVTINNGSFLESRRDFDANGTLTNNGRLQQTKNAVTTGTAFLFAGQYGGVSLSGANMGSTTVYIRGNQDCTSTAGATVRRCFEIAPTNTSGPAYVHFYFAASELSGNDCNALNAYHWNGSTWGSPLTLDTTWGADGRVCPGEGSAPYSVRVTGVTNFSPFVLKSGDAPGATPTAVRLVSFRGIAENTAIRLQWTTATELNNLGFNIYRATSVTSPRTRLNANLIPSKVLGSPIGATYEFRDQAVARGSTYYYWLETVDANSRATLYGPVQGSFTVSPLYLPFVVR